MATLAEALQRRRDLGTRIWASEVLPGRLYLGSGRDAESYDNLVAHGVTHVLNVADDVPNYHETDGLGCAGPFRYANLNVGDFGTDSGISRVFPSAVAVAHEALNGSGALLVHCANGSNRSATVVIAILMATLDCTLAEAWEHVCSRRRGACPLRDNREELLSYERETRGGANTMAEAGGALAPVTVDDSPVLAAWLASSLASEASPEQLRPR